MQTQRRMLFRAFVSAAVLFMAGSSLSASAEEREPGSTQVLRDKLQAERKAYIAENLILTEPEAKAFWPVYESYQKELGRYGERMIELIRVYGKESSTMTDETATKIVEQRLEIEHDRVNIQKAYLTKFRKILPPKKVARYYQLEDKIFAIVYAEAMAQVPLVQ